MATRAAVKRDPVNSRLTVVDRVPGEVRRLRLALLDF